GKGAAPSRAPGPGGAGQPTGSPQAQGAGGVGFPCPLGARERATGRLGRAGPGGLARGAPPVGAVTIHPPGERGEGEPANPTFVFNPAEDGPAPTFDGGQFEGGARRAQSAELQPVGEGDLALAATLRTGIGEEM